MKKHLTTNHHVGRGVFEHTSRENLDLYQYLRLAVVCDSAHGRRTDSALPYYEQSLIGGKWKAGIERAVNDGLLRMATPNEKLQHCTNDELKRLLRASGCKVSGKKVELIERIIAEVDESSIENLIICDVWMRTPEGDALLEKYRPHVINHKFGAYFSDKDVDACIERSKADKGNVDTDYVFYLLHKNLLTTLESEMTPNGEWGMLYQQYDTLYHFAMNIKQHDEALRCKVRYLTLRLSGVYSRGYIADFKFIRPPHFREIRDLLYVFELTIEDFYDLFIKELDEVWGDLYFHFFPYTELKKLFWDYLSGKELDLEDYSPLKKYGSTDEYGTQIKQGKETGEWYIERSLRQS